MCQIKPKVNKFFLEDKVTNKKKGFTLYQETDLPFLSHKILKPCHKKVLGNEDDNASDCEVVKNAKKFLFKDLKEALKEFAAGTYVPGIDSSCE